MKKTTVGLIGCGNIGPIYLENLTRKLPHIEVRAVSGLHIERAQARASEFGIPKACSTEELLQDPDIELILNLAIPAVHFETGMAVLAAGKGLYMEKPLAIRLVDGITLHHTARDANLPLGGAPDTFLGAGIRTCRKLIDDGWIGKPVGATSFTLNGGPESWHPDPEFFYAEGGGPLLDMGPYAITTLIYLLGPVTCVTGRTNATWKTRTIGSGPKKGQEIEVQVATHTTGLLCFQSGVEATVMTSFDVKAGSGHVPMEIYGSEGTLRVPDPNYFDGPVQIKRIGDKDWKEVPLLFPWQENMRGIGLADMAANWRAGKPGRASGDLMLHVLEILHGIQESSDSGSVYQCKHQCPQPETGLDL